MKKMTIGLLMLSMMLYAINIYAYESVSSQTNTATGYLEVRPGSNKSNQTLTLTQLNNYAYTVNQFLEAANQKMYDIDYTTLRSEMDFILSEIDGINSTEFQNDFSYYYSLYENMFSIYGRSIESRVVDGRGMWHRPFETNLTQVRQTLQEMKDMSINMLYVETFWLGRLIYPSSVQGTFQHGFTTLEGYGEYGTNLLKAFVEEGKAYGIEVHAWVENFFVGYGTSYQDSPILNANPSWALYNYDGSIVQRTEKNYLFMDPANPEVRRYLKDIYVEIVETMDVGSIHLDYIRYPVAKNTTSTSTTNNLDTGYSDFAEAEFKHLYGYEGDLRTLVVTNYQAAIDWKTYKKEVISDFVHGVYYEVKNANFDIGLSTAIFGNVESAINEKMQDWSSWAQEGLIEIITPMSYYQSSLTVGSETKRLTDLVGYNAFNYAGLAPTYMGYNEYLNTTQIQAGLSNNALGSVFFASQFYLRYRNEYSADQKAYADDVQKVLTEGLFRNDAVIPHEDQDLIISTVLSYLDDKANRIYIPRGGITQSNYNDLKLVLDQLALMPNDTINDFRAQIDAFKALQTSSYASGAARDRIAEDRNYLVSVLEAKYQRMVLDQTLDITVNPDPDHMEEAVVLSTPQNLRIENNQVVWDDVQDAIRYELVQEKDGHIESFIIDQTSYNLLDVNPGAYTFKVKAIGDGFFFEDSLYSPTLAHVVEAVVLDTPTNITVTDELLTFDSVEGALSYTIYINFSDFEVTSTSFDLSVFNLQPGYYHISIRANGNGYALLNSEVSEIYEYFIPYNYTDEELEILNLVEEEMTEIIFLLIGSE